MKAKDDLLPPFLRDGRHSAGNSDSIASASRRKGRREQSLKSSFEPFRGKHFILWRLGSAAFCVSASLREEVLQSA